MESIQKLSHYIEDWLTKYIKKSKMKGFVVGVSGGIDSALAIHPPILYLGYVGSSIIFSSALSAMCLNYVSKKWATHIKQWILIS